MNNLSDLSFRKEFRRGSGARNEILILLEENSEGLPVMDIYRCLRERGYNISQPAVSKNLKVLKEKGLVWKKRSFNPNVRRNLWHYISTASYTHIISESLHKEIIQIFSKVLEENAKRSPQFENIPIFTRFIEKIVQTAVESLTSSEGFWLELSKKEPYGELSLIARDYKSVVANISKIIQFHPRLKKYTQRRAHLNLIPSLAADSPCSIALAIVDGSIRGEKRYLKALDFLRLNPVENFQEKIEESIEWIKCYRDSVQSSRGRARVKKSADGSPTK